MSIKSLQEDKVNIGNDWRKKVTRIPANPSPYTHIRKWQNQLQVQKKLAAPNRIANTQHFISNAVTRKEKNYTWLIVITRWSLCTICTSMCMWMLHVNASVALNLNTCACVRRRVQSCQSFCRATYIKTIKKIAPLSMNIKHSHTFSKWTSNLKTILKSTFFKKIKRP